MQQAAMGGYQQAGMEEMVEEYNAKFGLDKPLWQQYLTYLGDMARLDFNYSIANYPQTVNEMMRRGAPLDDRAPGDDDPPLVRARHAPRRACSPGRGRPVPQVALPAAHPARTPSRSSCSAWSSSTSSPSRSRSSRSSAATPPAPSRRPCRSAFVGDVLAHAILPASRSSSSRSAAGRSACGR